MNKRMDAWIYAFFASLAQGNTIQEASEDASEYVQNNVNSKYKNEDGIFGSTTVCVVGNGQKRFN